MVMDGSLPREEAERLAWAGLEASGVAPCGLPSGLAGAGAPGGLGWRRVDDRVARAVGGTGRVMALHAPVSSRSSTVPAAPGSAPDLA